ncbi:MAG: hypothetical protein K0R34_360 [Herbinix sp.]|jgi:hypothetical protein|nr:hypothetical protein [Herbinix sp.]
MEISNEKKFSLTIDKVRKTLKAEAHGKFNPADAGAFVEEYTKLVGQINPQEYTLSFDSTKLQVSSTDMVPLLTACLELYKKDNFKKIIFDCTSNATLKLQIHRLSKLVELPNYEII